MPVNSPIVHADVGEEYRDLPVTPTVDRELAGGRDWSRVRLAAFGVYALALVLLVVLNGVPTQRPLVVSIVVTALALTAIGEGWHRLKQVLVDWVPFAIVLLLYDRTRGLAHGLSVPLHEKDIVQAEEWIFGGTTPTVWLQQHLYDPATVHWYDALCTLVYTSHFLATPVLAAVLWIRNRRSWLRFISRVIVLSLAGLVTYIAFPEAPPWMASQHGLIAHVDRLSPRGWAWFGFDSVGDLLEKAQNSPDSNPVAAMPSLHVAFAVLVAIFVGTALRRRLPRLRWLLALYPLAMGFTLVYDGEHYVLDLVFGVLYALATHVALTRWEARRHARAVGAG